jgi:hypothetical protein
MKTKTIQIYDFNELSESAQDKAIDNIRTINNEYYEWWDSIYEDAETIGLCLTGFGLDRHRHATGNFKDSAECCAHFIIDNHGETCETYKTATAYLADRFNTIEKAPLNEDGELESEYNLDCDLNDLDAEFLRSILEDYSMSLQREYEYKDSKENILGVIACNGYTFTEYGKIENV